MKDIKDAEVSFMLENLSIDLRAEVVVTDLAKKGFSIVDLLVRPAGLFKRRFGKDIAGVEKMELKKHSALVITLNREGLYDVLPQALFHGGGMKPKPFKDVQEMVEEVKQRVKEEEAARLFFLAYEIEFFRQRLAIEWQERKMLDAITYTMDDEELLSYWNLPELLDQKQKGIIFYLYPIMHKIRGNLHLMEKTYCAILNENVAISKSGINAKRKNTALNFNILGKSHLSKTSVLGKKYTHIYENIFIDVTPSDVERIFDYLPGGKRRKIIEYLNSFFMPLTVESEIRILTQNIEKHTKEWRLQSKERYVSRLGYSLYL